MIGKTLHDYRIISEIGKGGMGVVYLAEHTVLPKRFAIKSLSNALSSDPNFRERFYGEAQKQAPLDHPNIVQVTNFFEEGGQFFLVMEYVDGQDLSKFIKTGGKLLQKEAQEKALRIFEDILRGLGFAHSKNIIHRDIKPSNVLIDKSGRARISDFGIAILEEAGQKRLTGPGVAVGSPWYMSPEQIRHPQDIDHRSDIYSAGIVLYEMFTGEVPFDGETDFSIQDQQIHSPAPDPCQKNPKISPELAHIILKAMAKDPRERFQDCAEFLQRIQEIRFPTKISKLWLLVLAMLMSIGILLYRIPPPPPPDGSTEIIKMQHQAAFNLIQTASEKAQFLCTEFKEVTLKKKSLESVQALGEQHIDNIGTNLIDLQKRQIQDLEKNIKDAMSGYVGFIAHLVDFKDDIVEEEFNEYARSLEKKESFAQIRTTSLTKAHYQQYRKDKKSVNSEMMQSACAQELG